MGCMYAQIAAEVQYQQKTFSVTMSQASTYHAPPLPNLGEKTDNTETAVHSPQGSSIVI